MGATIATGVACVFLLVTIGKNPQTTPTSNVKHDDIDVKSFALAFGTILFSFGGAPAFPTIQHDMQNSSDFPKAIFLGFLGRCIFLYKLSGC